MADETAEQANVDDSATQSGDKWGDPISEERQAELQVLFERQKMWVAQPEAARGESVFEDIELTGADVYWLAEASGRDSDEAVPNLHLGGANLMVAQLAGAKLSWAHLAGAKLSWAQLARADLSEAHLAGAFLMVAHLEGANLSDAHLEGANLSEAHLEGADLSDAHLEGANLFQAQLAGAYLSDAHLEGAKLSEAHLEGAFLIAAHLEGANLRQAHLERAKLSHAQLAEAILYDAHLEGADLSEAQLAGAYLTSATFDKATHLNDTVLTGASLDQVTYDGVNLTVVDWSLVPVLGDELWARRRKDRDGKPKSREQRLNDFTAAVRADRVLAVTLRSQGMNEDADRYAYRAQLLQRTLLRLRRQYGSAFGSWLLDLISGYGYQPIRSVFTYALVILTFAAAYFALTNFALTPFLPSHSSPLAWYEAIVLSISSFHGRGLFPTGLSLGDPIAILAAVEAVIGLLIEITFIATFTQRFFAR